MPDNRAFRVLVVDDSNLMRTHICSALVEHGMITDTAENGEVCLQKITRFKPDVITLDINMPVMDGLTCLEKIMAQCPTPVIMVSSLTQKHANETLKALEIGALDYIAKPNGPVSLTLNKSKYMLVSKVINAAKVSRSKPLDKPNSSFTAAKYPATPNVVNTASPKLTTNNTDTLRSVRLLNPSRPAKRRELELVIIGVSTGGPVCLQEIIPKLPASYPVPIIIAQHMPSRFTQVFATRMDKMSKLSVHELNAETRLMPGNAYVAQGDANVILHKRNNGLSASPDTSETPLIWKPSITLLVESALKHISPSKLCCVQLTGMGNDGAKAMATAHQKGAFTIAESQQTATVYGMPKELVKFGGASKVLPNFEIAQTLMSLL
ncbi:chemotaxis-specific protein-glutamate methyltransferase CheB [Ningiella sp. W23]|uniref:chemotaxis-specific protein-glutamate methyltransferase CheB n=1 Tax=Ningiella sp. W23 TaxID=3023715 RepID=UPI003756C843